MNRQSNIILIFFLSLPNFIQADFVAFRKLTDPKTNNIVYLLYDYHATIDSNPKSTQELIEKVTLLNREEAKKTNKRPDRYKINF